MLIFDLKCHTNKRDILQPFYSYDAWDKSFNSSTDSPPRMCVDTLVKIMFQSNYV